MVARRITSKPWGTVFTAWATTIRSKPSLDVAVPKGYTFAAEVGLSGELRNVPKMEQRMQEAPKLGFERMVVAQAVKTVPQGLEVIRLATIQDLVAHLF